MTFWEPVLGLLSPDFVYVYMNRIETNYPVCRLYHYYIESLQCQCLTYTCINDNVFEPTHPPFPLRKIFFTSLIFSHFHSG